MGKKKLFIQHHHGHGKQSTSTWMGPQAVATAVTLTPSHTFSQFSPLSSSAAISLNKMCRKLNPTKAFWFCFRMLRAIFSSFAGSVQLFVQLVVHEHEIDLPKCSSILRCQSSRRWPKWQITWKSQFTLYKIYSWWVSGTSTTSYCSI